MNFTAKLDWLVGAEKGRGGLAATDKGKKELKTVLSLVRGGGWGESSGEFGSVWPLAAEDHDQEWWDHWWHCLY